jgi:RNA polymerase sigma-70 factor, ECF subfamily
MHDDWVDGTNQHADPGGRAGDAYLRFAYETYSPAVRRFAQRLTRDADAANDFAQETFARLARASSLGRPPERLAPWLFRVCANLVVSEARKRRTFEAACFKLESRQMAAEPDDEVLKRERDAMIAAALATLAPDARRALQLAAVGWRGRETARAIGRTEEATRSMLFRSRARLRRDLRDLVSMEPQ